MVEPNGMRPLCCKFCEMLVHLDRRRRRCTATFGSRRTDLLLSMHGTCNIRWVVADWLESKESKNDTLVKRFITVEGVMDLQALPNQLPVRSWRLSIKLFCSVTEVYTHVCCMWIAVVLELL